MAHRAEYDRYVATGSARLLRVAYLLTRDWASAEDLLQAALVKLWFAWSRVDGDPEWYVRKIIVTTFTSWRRRLWVNEISHADLPEPQPADDLTDRYADREALWRALGDLPPRQRAVLVLRYFEDLTEEQTAQTLGISVGAVKSQASKALTRLRGQAGLLTAFNANTDPAETGWSRRW